MNIIQRLSKDYVVTSKSVKDTIVWHFTAGGSLAGAEAELAKPDKINVHFIIDKDGQIYQYIKEDNWAYHTGQNAAKDAQGNILFWCKRSFGVEIVNWGGLQLKDGLFLPWTKSKKQAVNPKYVFQLHYPRFGYDYYEALTIAQRDSVIWLDKYLSARHKIKYKITHADISYRKHDFPPDYPGLIRVPEDFYYTYTKEQKPANPQTVTYVNGDAPYEHSNNQPDPTLIKYAPQMPIERGREGNYTKQQIQSRINFLLKNYGWNGEEVGRLVVYRDSHQ